MNKYFKIEESKPNSNEPNLIICLNSDAFQHHPPKGKRGTPSRRLYDDDECVKRWKDELGDRLANLLELPPGKRYSLKNFPKNYYLYKYANYGPSTMDKTVLYGDCPPKRFWSYRHFASSHEFLLHLYWLCTNSREAVGKCQCRKCTSRKQREVKLFITELEQSKQSERLKAARNQNDDDDEKPLKKVKIQEVDLFHSSPSSIVFEKKITQESKVIQILFSDNISQISQGSQINSEQFEIDIFQASNEIKVPFPSSSVLQASVQPIFLSIRSKRTQTSHKLLSSDPTNTQTSKERVQSSRSRITQASKGIKSTPHLSSQASLTAEPSSQYQFSIQPINQKLKDDKSYKSKTHLINHDVIPSSLPQYRYLELVWFKLKKPIEIPASIIKEEKSIKIKLWPSIVLSIGSKFNETPKPFHIRLLGIHKTNKSVFDHELLPWRSYNYEKLRNQLRCQIEINEEIEESLIYEDYQIAMTNLSYAIQISVHLHSMISLSENDENELIESQEYENYDNQIWFGAEVLSIGDFVILNETINQKQKQKFKSKSELKEDEKTCKVMLIGEIQKSNQYDQHSNQLYELTGHLFTTLISKKSNLNQIKSNSKTKKNDDENDEIALQPYFKDQINPSRLLRRNSTSGFEFDLITETGKESGMKVKRLSNVVVEPERIQNSSMSEVCGLRVEEEIKKSNYPSRLIIPSRISAISFAIQKAREDLYIFNFHDLFDKKRSSVDQIISKCTIKSV
ncbi:uncharacterized protein MELLADRAFT_101837 [Melampsora larici-populina 98AG31]|uniref:Cryptic loci regulator 2 N-terminal domain-containing protein n=1 Tax=Melampsora larici-populina (strain 98AG31 / pathotype 3-4-7) TaxID=747676 RepID=F4R525_MELLP|nr:uncharacterized protein MELLADRAFT_101837 [Melampsora larici-populina 98AG31]EGG11984.1 hypothetical protein MELLADRAFT_101837 [Melampsora larici-populina 98AG31]